MEIKSAYTIILWFHYFISGTFLFIAFWLLIRSFRGIYKNLPYIKLDKTLAYLFIINLYLQLLLGFILFTNLSIFGYDYQSADGSIATAAKRLWPVEHIVLMLFALFIANLGLIFSAKSNISKIKHRKIILYYAISIALIGISLASIYWF
jgi:heme A synthase